MKTLALIFSMLMLSATSLFAQNWTETANYDPNYYGTMPLTFPQQDAISFGYEINSSNQAHLSLTVNQPATHLQGEIDIAFVECYINFYDSENNLIGGSDFYQYSSPYNGLGVNCTVSIPTEAVKVEFYYATNGYDQDNVYADEKLVVFEPQSNEQ